MTANVDILSNLDCHPNRSIRQVGLLSGVASAAEGRLCHVLCDLCLAG